MYSEGDFESHWITIDQEKSGSTTQNSIVSNLMNKLDEAKKWANFTFIKSIVFNTDLGDGTCCLEIDVAENNQPGSKAFSIRFEGVAQFNLGEIGGGMSKFVRLDIVDLSDQQWDRLNYRIFDYEGDKISFLCQDFEIVKEYNI